MRLHTNLTYSQVLMALVKAKKKGRIADEVHPVVFRQEPSSTHPRAFEIQLGSESYAPIPEPVNRWGRTQKARRRSQNARSWAATWREWGWFIAEVFEADSDSRWGTRPKYDGNDSKRWGYFSPDDFDRKTKYEFDLSDDDPLRGDPWRGHEHVNVR